MKIYIENLDQTRHAVVSSDDLEFVLEADPQMGDFIVTELERIFTVVWDDMVTVKFDYE